MIEILITDMFCSLKKRSKISSCQQFYFIINTISILRTCYTSTKCFMPPALYKSIWDLWCNVIRNTFVLSGLLFEYIKYLGVEMRQSHCKHETICHPGIWLKWIILWTVIILIKIIKYRPRCNSFKSHDRFLYKYLMRMCNASWIKQTIECFCLSRSAELLLI